MERSEPPLQSLNLLVGDRWWGAGVMVLRGQPPKTEHQRRPSPGLDSLVDVYLRCLPGDEAILGKARWSNGTSKIAQRSVAGWDDRWVDAEIVAYAEAEVEVDEWRRVVTPQASASVALIGLKNGVPVAVIAPRKDPTAAGGR